MKTKTWSDFPKSFMERYFWLVEPLNRAIGKKEREQIFEDMMDNKPCHLKPISEWCDLDRRRFSPTRGMVTRGDFMGHTCQSVTPMSVLTVFKTGRKKRQVKRVRVGIFHRIFGSLQKMILKFRR